MDTTYDCTADVLEHRRKVAYWLNDWRHQLEGRAAHHDESKLREPEKAIFDAWPKSVEIEFGSDAYHARLAAMGEGLKHHYAVNRHHPEHYPNGVAGMTLMDLVEMLADWMAAHQERGDGKPMDMAYLAERFGIEPQLMSILVNTLREEDYWSAANGSYNAHWFRLASSWSEAASAAVDHTDSGWVGFDLSANGAE